MICYRSIIKCPFVYLVVLLLFLNNCNSVTREEVSRIKSPDSLVEAILIKENAHATTSFVYRIYIIPYGKKETKDDEIFKADKVDGLSINWKEDKLLDIEYKRCRIFHFVNFWLSEEVQNYRYVVEMRLVPLDLRSLQ